VVFKDKISFYLTFSTFTPKNVQRRYCGLSNANSNKTEGFVISCIQTYISFHFSSTEEFWKACIMTYCHINLNSDGFIL